MLRHVCRKIFFFLTFNISGGEKTLKDVRHVATSYGDNGGCGSGDLKRKQGWEGEQGPEVNQ